MVAWHTVRLGVVLLLLAGIPTARSQSSAPSGKVAMISFTFERSGLAVPRFEITVNEDGVGTYQADETEKHVTQQANMPSTAMGIVKHIERPMMLSMGMTEKIFKAARSLKRFNTTCASKAKNIADTGTKTLTYTGVDGTGSCTYNYSEDKNVILLTGWFQGIAFTMDEGRKLDYLHRYDRLGLDAEMQLLVQAIEEKNALELRNISSTLTSIVRDTDLMQRVRVRASALLGQAADNR